jgi:hypothetical protein
MYVHVYCMYFSICIYVFPVQVFDAQICLGVYVHVCVCMNLTDDYPMIPLPNMHHDTPFQHNEEALA